MEVLLIYLPHRLHDAPRHFPLGLGILAEVLRLRGHEVKVLDINGERPGRGEVWRRLRGCSFDVAGIGGLTSAYSYAKWLLPLLKRRNPSAKVVAGGSLASPLPELFLKNNPSADAVVMGEGEETLPELLAAWERGDDLSQVKGIAFRRNGDVVHTPPRPPIADLDSIPYPAWELFPMEVYLRHPVVGIGRDMNVITSRGCPHGCTYCYRLFGRGYRFRSAGKMVEEIAILKERFAIDFVSFQDDCFVANRKRVLDFCEMLEASGLGVKWSCCGRVNICDEKMLCRMKEAGCVSVSYGIESGSQRILDIIKKGVTVEQARRALRATRRLGLRAPVSFMLGVPGETPETIQETIDFCREEKIPLQSIMLATPYPGTPLYAWALERGL
ncbi:MAG: B12-binding domain-containing radical SAM protein, partial [Nitrospinota bacterium]